MMTPGLKSLENCAQATGRAFGFEESDFDARYVAPARPGRVAAFLLALVGGAVALAHQLGFTQAVASLGPWRSV